MDTSNAFAIVSDIHSNLEALQAVLADAENRGVKEIVCLGDVIGYGPNPGECLDIIRERARLCLMGNHDHAVLFEPCNFNLPAERACYWTRRLLEGEPDVELRNARWDFLGSLPARVEEDNILFVHGSPRRPINEYVFPEDVFTNPQKVMANFDRLGAHLCFSGHTHQPGVFLDAPYFDPPNELLDSPFYQVENEPAIVNVGSVGQPRDRDPRASYVIVYREPGNGEEQLGQGSLVQAATRCQVEQIEFVRVEYDIDATVAKIREQAELDDLLGNRLYDGR